MFCTKIVCKKHFLCHGELVFPNINTIPPCCLYIIVEWLMLGLGTWIFGVFFYLFYFIYTFWLFSCGFISQFCVWCEKKALQLKIKLWWKKSTIFIHIFKFNVHQNLFFFFSNDENYKSKWNIYCCWIGLNWLIRFLGYST